MRFFKYCIFLILIIQQVTLAANNNDYWEKEAVRQLNYLYERNNSTDIEKSEEEWYIFLCGANVEELQYVIDESQKISSGYLSKLNEELKRLNSGNKTAVYVAFTIFDLELFTTIFPENYNTLSLQENYLRNFLRRNNTQNHYDNLVRFKYFTSDFSQALERIYQSSFLSKATDIENIVMPFTMYNTRYLIPEKPDGEYERQAKWTYTLYTAKQTGKDSIVAGQLKKIYNSKQAVFGTNNIEQKMERVVSSLYTYYYEERPEYKPCEELLADKKFELIVNDEIWGQVVKNDPCILNRLIKLEGDYIGETEFSRDLNRMVCTMLYGAFAIPAAAIVGEAALYETGKYLIEKYGAKKAKDVAQAAATNIIIQAVINYYFDENSFDTDTKIRWEKAIENIDKVSLSKDIFVAAYDINMRGDLVLECVIGGLEYNEEKWYDISEYDFNSRECIDNVIQQILLGSILKTGGAVFSKLKRVAKENPEMFIKGFREMLHDVGAEGANAFKSNVDELIEAFDITKGSLIDIKLRVEASYGNDIVINAEDNIQLASVDNNTTTIGNNIKTTSGETSFKNLIKDVISDIEYNISKNSSDVVKVGANIELNFNLPSGSQNIRPTILTELSDGTYRMVFVVNKNMPVTSITDFLPHATSGRKAVLENFSTNIQATLKGNNAQKYFGKSDTHITVKEVEFYTHDGNGGVVRSRIDMNFKNFTTLIDDKIKILQKEKLYGNQAETFLKSDYVTAELLYDTKLYRRFGGDAKLGGSYASTFEKLSRDELALVKEFNNSMRFEATLKVPKGEKINLGKVGPWPPKAPEYMGGADQVILKYNYPENVWVESIKDFQTGKIYTYGEFKQAFPNLCK